jgi:hypothetical protein
MTDDTFGPMNESEARQFAEKLGTLSGSLNAKERWFLSEILARGVEAGSIDSEVSGYAALGATVYYPAGMGTTFGATSVGTAEASYMKMKPPGS